MVEGQGLKAVIVNPSTPIGPRDIRPTPTGRIIVEAANGKVPAFIQTGLNLAHVDDIAEGHIHALEKGRIGERYVLGGQDVSLQGPAGGDRRAGRAAGADDRAAARAALSAGLRRGVRGGDHGQGAVHHRRCAEHGPLSDVLFPPPRAERELGYSARPYEQAVADAVAWFRQAGYLK